MAAKTGAVRADAGAATDNAAATGLLLDALGLSNAADPVIPDVPLSGLMLLASFVNPNENNQK